MDEKGHRNQGGILDHQCQFEAKIIAVGVRVTPFVVFVFEVFLPDFLLEDIQIERDGRTVDDELPGSVASVLGTGCVEER